MEIKIIPRQTDIYVFIVAHYWLNIALMSIHSIYDHKRSTEMRIRVCDGLRHMGLIKKSTYILNK